MDIRRRGLLIEGNKNSGNGGGDIVLDYESQYFTLHMLSEGDMTLYTPSSYTPGSLAYSVNNSDWITFSSNTTLTLVTDDKVRVKCVTNAYTRGFGITMFSSACDYEGYGNAMSLLYGDNFQGQTTLTTQYSFRALFYNQTKLKSAENLILPATTLAKFCYQYMFYGCTSLTTAPELPATTLVNYCYDGMFYGCTNLTTVPTELPATTLADYCYNYMFRDCTSLTTAPELPATTLKNCCYYYMFYGCSSLTSAPSVLPATTLANYCYYSMFYGCTSLTTAPELPATTLKNYCYNYMFRDCTSLTTAPELPATTLKGYCYRYMFSNCTSLTSAPELPATTLADECYYGMFANTTVLPDCSNIDFTSEAVVASGGLKGLFAETKVTDVDLERILPKNDDNKYYLPATTLANWCYGEMFYGCTSLKTAPELPATTLADRCYGEMFYGCTSLTTAPQLPATTLANYCYSSMFSYCTSLTTAPELPATTLAKYCYYNMFQGCTGLTEAPKLPAKTLADECYYYMFYGCKNLTEAPQLPATTLANYCYDSMFAHCTSLTTAPELPATTLADYCYNYMFYGCSKLNKITMLATNIDANDCLTYWVHNVASSGTFIKNGINIPSGSDGIPNGWTVQVITPSIVNTLLTPINFQYIDGIFTPNNKPTNLSEYFSEEELLSVQPECDICVNIVNKNNNTLASDYVWVYSKTLDDILKELNITDNVFDITILINNVHEPEDGGYYYYYVDVPH